MHPSYTMAMRIKNKHDFKKFSEIVDHYAPPTSVNTNYTRLTSVNTTTSTNNNAVMQQRNQTHNHAKDVNALKTTYTRLGYLIVVVSAFVFPYMSWCETTAKTGEAFDFYGYKLFPCPSTKKITYNMGEIVNVATALMIVVGFPLAECRLSPDKHHLEKLWSKLTMVLIYYVLWFFAANDSIEFSQMFVFIVMFSIMTIRVFINSRDVHTTDIKLIYV